VLIIPVANVRAEEWSCCNGGTEKGQMKRARQENGWKQKREKINQKLGISEEQSQKLDAHRAQHRQSARTLRQEIQQKRQLIAKS